MAMHADEEIPLSLARSKVSSRSAAFRERTPVLEPFDSSLDADHFATNVRPDRLTPSVAGGLVGFLGGLAGLAVVHGIDAAALTKPLANAAGARGVDLDIAFVVAYVTAASVGALLGATFAVVTRYLRKWVPLTIWALVFFVSLATLLLATANSPTLQALAGPIIAASALFGIIVSFSLPIRRRA